MEAIMIILGIGEILIMNILCVWPLVVLYLAIILFDKYVVGPEID